MISTAPFGSQIALPLPDSASNEQQLPQSSADFRPEGKTPETLADLLPHVSSEAKRRYGKAFRLVLGWQAKPAEEILLSHLFLRLTMAEFRPFLRDKSYMENTIVAYRKGLCYLYNLAASHGVQVEPEYKEAWLPAMKLAQESHIIMFAEHFEANFDSPNDVTIEAVNERAEELVKMGLKRMSGARKAKYTFLHILRQCGYIDQQPVAAARDQDYGVRAEDLPYPLRSEVEELRAWARKGDDDGEWHMDWDRYDNAETVKYLKLREVTADKVVSEICRTYGFVKNICHREEGINSLESLLHEKIVRSYQAWLQHERKAGGTGMKTRLGTMFSTLKYFPGAANINLTWVPALLSSIPKTPRTEVEARKRPRVVAYSVLEAIPNLLRKECSRLIAVHNRAEKAAASRGKRGRGGWSTEEKLAKVRATRLVRIAVLAQQELIIRYLVVLAWRNENLSGCRIHLTGGLHRNLFQGPVVPCADMDIPDWAREEIKRDPNVELLQFFFDIWETKAGRPVMAVLPKLLVPPTVEFLEHYREILLCGDDPGTLFVNQTGGAMSEQQLEEAVEEATLRYAGKSVNPHLFRDIFALEYLRENDANYMNLSKILWHGSPEITVRKYAWMFNESVGTNAAGEWMEAREREKLMESAGAKKMRGLGRSSKIPMPPPSPFIPRQNTPSGK